MPREDEQDLLAFQRRVIEICKSYEYPTRRIFWFIILMIAITCVNGILWYNHANENNIPLSEMYWSRPSFTITLGLTLLLFILRFHELADARNIIMNNLRDELKPFQLSCTDNGILILIHTFQYQIQGD